MDNAGNKETSLQLTEALKAAELGDIQTAKSSLHDILKTHPGHVDANFELGKLLFESDRLEEARLFLELVVHAIPDHELGLYYLGAITFAQSEWKTSQAIFQKLLSFKPGDSRFLNNLGNIAFEQKEYQSAVEYYQAAVDANPVWWEAMSNKGSALERLNLIPEALSCYEKAYTIAPDEVSLVVATANALLEANSVDRAGQIIDRFRATGPQILETEILHGRILLARGQFDESFLQYQSLLKNAPDIAEVWIDLGHAYCEAMEFDQGTAAFEEAIRRGADELVVGPNFGKALLGAGDFEGALEIFHRMQKLEPLNIDHLLNLSVAYLQAGDENKSFSWLENANRMKPGNVDVLRTMAVRKLNSGDHDTAMELASRIMEFDPGSSIGYHLMAEICQDRSDYEAAIKFVGEGLNHNPSSKLLLHKAFNLQAFHGNNLSAIECGKRCLELFEEDPDIEPRLIHIVQTCCEWEFFAKLSQKIIRNVEHQVGNNQRIATSPNNLQGTSLPYEFLVKAGKNASDQIIRKMEPYRRHTSFNTNPNRYATNSRIRIGYLVPYTTFHSMPLQLLKLVELHDRSKFEIFGYSIMAPDHTNFSKVFVESFDQFRWSESTVELATKIHEDNINILVDNSGHTESNCLDVCALKPAAVSIHYMGYTMSLGAEFMDYVISDPDLITSDQKDAGPEKLIYLCETIFPASGLAANDFVPTRKELGLPEDAFVFCNFNQPFKIEPEIFSTWIDILKAVPDSVLWLGDWNDLANDKLLEFATKEGLDGNRIIFGEIARHGLHLARLSRADLCIDTFFHGGGVTSLDCLWAGLPIISARGETPASRLGSIFLRAHGMPELIVNDLAAYRDLAIRLARDPDRLAEIRQRCDSNRYTNFLFDTPRMVANLERSYEAVWQRFLSDQPPQHIYVSGDGVETENPSG
jgi:protein O-GlcNAc transferase